MSLLARIIAHVTRAAPSDAAQDIARRAMLDTCAVIRAGRDSDSAAKVATALTACSTGASAQAMRLGTAAHALDFDDYEDVGSTHPSACILPALIAVSAEGDSTMDDLIAAYIAGFETILCLGSGLGHAHYLRGWHATPTLGLPGAAVAVGHLLGLRDSQLVAALSIGMTQSAGMKAQFGSDTKALHCGFAARGGLEAAYLAQAGLSARDRVVRAPSGFFDLYGGDGSPGWSDSDPLPVIENHPPYFKPWPCCAYTHRAVEAAERLSAKVAVTPETLRDVTLDIPAPYHEVAGFRAPRSDAEARFSNAWCAASTLLDGVLSVESFAPENRDRAAVAALERQIQVRTYPLPQGAGDMSAAAPDTLCLTLADGQSLSETVRNPRGGPVKPMQRADLIAKFQSCGGSLPLATAILTGTDSAALHHATLT